MNVTAVVIAGILIVAIVGAVVFMALRNQSVRNAMLGELARLAAQIESVERERLAKTNQQLADDRAALANATATELQIELNKRRLPP